MLRLFRRMLGSARPATPAAAHKTRLSVESLDARELPAADWTAVSATVSAGQATVIARAADLTRDALDPNLPGVAETLGSAVALGGLLGDAVKVSPGGVTTAAQMTARLRLEGFTVLAANDDPDAAGRVLVATKTVTRTVGGTFAAGNVDGFRYWDQSVTGGLTGGARVSGRATAKVTFGVNLSGGQYQYWLAPDSAVTVSGLKGTGRATGGVRIGTLGGVSVTAGYAIDLTAGVRLNDLDGSGRVELDELRNRRAATGDVDGSIRLAATFVTRVAGVPLTFQGQFGATVHNGEARTSEQLVRPNYEAFGRGVAVAFFSGRPVLDVLKPVQGLLNRKVPLTNKTVADFIKLNGVSAAVAGVNPGITGGTAYDDVVSKLKAVGVTFGLTREAAADTLDKLMRGEKADLIRQTVSVDKTWSLVDKKWPIALFDAGIASASLSVYVRASVGVKGTVTMGLDGGGVYVGTDTALGVTASASAGFDGSLRVIGFKVASASGGLGLSLALNAKVKDPTPGDDKVYVSELKGKPLSSLIGGNLTVDLGGELKAKVFGFKVYSKSFNFGRLVNANLG